MSNITRTVQRLLIAAVVLVLPGMLSLLFFFGAEQVRAAENPVLECDAASPASGCIFLGIEGKYVAGGATVLNRINEIRYEACTSGNVQDPRNPSRFLTKSDYVPIKWSKALESISRIRAAEASLTHDHARLNGKEIWSVSADGVESNGEVLAWNSNVNALYGVNQWYAEKADWMRQDKSKDTGHYQMMINPDFTYVGVASFYSENAPEFPNTTAGSFSKTTAGLDQTILNPTDTILQKLEVLTSEIKDLEVGPVYENETETPEITLRVKGRSLRPIDPPVLNSKDSAVLAVQVDGKLSGVSRGNAVLEITIGSYSVTKTVTVGCRHNYNFSDPDVNHRVTGTCTKCGYTFTASVPSEYSLFWKNSTSQSNMYMSGVPTSNPVGSVLEILVHSIDGAEEYQDLVIESSDEHIVKVGDTSTKFKKLLIAGSGSAIITVYPKYNPKLKTNYTVKTGGTGKSSKVILVFNGRKVKKTTSSVMQTKTKKQKTVSKAANSIQILLSSKTLKAKALKKKAQKFLITAKDLFGAKIQFTLDKKATPKKSRKYIKVSSTGKVTVKKGTPKGTYRITVKAAAKEGKTFKASSAIKVIKIKVKK